MSDRSPATSEGEGDEIRPYGEDLDSSEESEDDDPEEARRIAEGFIQDDDDDDEADGEGNEEDDEAERRRRRKEKKRRRRRERERRRREEEQLSEDEIELINENRGFGGPSRKRFRGAQDEQGEEEEGGPTLKDMFKEDEGKRAPGLMDDDDDDDMGDFIEEDEDEEGVAPGETEQERRDRKREEKIKRREAARIHPDIAGVDRQSWDEIYAVFGDGAEYDWALEGEDGEIPDDELDIRKDIRLEDVFDPSEIKDRHLQDEDKAIAQADRPERHQLVNSTLSSNPVLSPDSLFPPPNLAAGWAYNRISTRTQYLFCAMHPDGSWPLPDPNDPYRPPAVRRFDLAADFLQVVETALNLMFVQNLEVPYLWHYKRDAFSVLENQGRTAVQFLERDELWTLYGLGIKFRAIWDRCQQLTNTWEKIKIRRPDVQDDYLTQTLLSSVCNMSVEAAAEGAEWLAYHYTDVIRSIKEEEALESGGKKLPPKTAAEDMRQGPIMQLVASYGISVPSVAVTFNDPHGSPTQPINPDKLPKDLAAEYCGEGTHFRTPEDALKAASQILITEFSKDPTIRQQSREFVDTCGTITVTPTERGMVIIDEYHTYSTFKFLHNKPIDQFKSTPQFLHMLQAEQEGLITISFSVEEHQIKSFADALVRCVHSNDYGEVSMSWNALREEICRTVVSKCYIPAAYKWAKDHLRAEAEEFVAEQCRIELEYRVNVRPYQAPNMEPGNTPSVLAITMGKGLPTDAVMAIMLDERGNIRTQTKFDNLRDTDHRNDFIELVDKRRPDVVVIGGMSAQTAKLRDDATSALRELALRLTGLKPPVSETYSSPDEYAKAMAEFESRLKPSLIPLTFVNDATARLFMNSEESSKEFPALPLNGRYAVGLARYTQNPLNAYCHLGKYMTSITFLEHHQKLVPEERLLVHLERGLVNCVCATGVEINSCVGDPYQRTMLPFVSGLGPRKADALVNAIHKQGFLLNRAQLTDLGILGPTIFENVAGFLTIEGDLKDFMLDEETNPVEQPEPLDMTRIHPADYEFAQKMCQDALDLDAEDVADQHKSQVVLQLMQDEDRAQKLSELSLDDFAFNLQSQGEGNKRHVLKEIVNELTTWRADRRPNFYVPSDWEVVTMLTGETERTIGRGLRVIATVRKALTNRVFLQLESGIDVILEREYVADEDDINVPACNEIFRPRQAVKGVIIAVEPHRLQVRLSTRPSDLSQSVPFVQPFRDEPYNDPFRRKAAEEREELKKRREKGQIKRVINHPNWHTGMNSGQAEQFLASLHRGDVVIRPSSMGSDHLAVTWKVDEDVYQHIDVQEIDKPNEHALGRILRVAGKYSYSDLDDLIINHVKAMSRKFDEMQMHEKFRPEHELESYLKNYVQAHPGRSMYGFAVDSSRPGYLKLCFLNKSTKDGGVIQTWPVKVLPGAYQLNDAEVPGVLELCNAFKAQYSSRLAEQGSGGKTPGIRMAKTPMVGGRTPGGMGMGMGGVGGRTPAMRGGATPYGAGGGRTPAQGGYGGGGYGSAPPPPPPGGGYGYNGPQGGGQHYPPPPQPGYGGPPLPPPLSGGGYPPPPPPGSEPSRGGMNPERAAAIARQGGGY